MRYRIGKYSPSYTPKGKSAARGSLGDFMQSPRLFAAMLPVGKQVALTAQILAPLGETGDYSESFEVSETPKKVVIVTKEGHVNPRVAVEVFSAHPAAAAQEFGSGVAGEGATGKSARPQGGWNTANHTLYRAALSVGRADD